MEKNSTTNEIFDTYKYALDIAFETTCKKYGIEHASYYMYEYLTSYNEDSIRGFTRENNARNIMYKINDTGYYQLFQILSDYVLTTFLNGDMNFEDITKEELQSYQNDNTGENDYSNQNKIIRLAAASLVENTHFTLTTFSINRKMKNIIVEKFIKDRYLSEKKDELDNSSKKDKIVNLFGKPIIVSRNTQNIKIKSMIKDAEEEFIPFTMDDINEYKNANANLK